MNTNYLLTRLGHAFNSIQALDTFLVILVLRVTQTCLLGPNQKEARHRFEGDDVFKGLWTSNE